MKNYKCVCPVCNKYHQVAADFISGNHKVCQDSQERILHSCGQHTSDELKAAWKKRNF